MAAFVHPVVIALIIICVELQMILVVSQESQTLPSSSEIFEAKPLSPGSGKKPNFVVFLVDDLGIADVGCFGNDTIKTPNIDRLASMGVKLNHNLAPESICTPSRAATLTGRYAIRSGMAAGPNAIRVPILLGIPGGLPSNETTFSSILQRSGYKTSKDNKCCGAVFKCFFCLIIIRPKIQCNNGNALNIGLQCKMVVRISTHFPNYSYS